MRTRAGTTLFIAGMCIASMDAVACCANYQEYANACIASGGVPSKNPLACSPKSSSSSSSASAGDSIGTVIGAELGKALGAALFGDPASDARKAAERQAAAQRAAEREAATKAEADTAAETRVQALLSAMLDTEQSPAGAQPSAPSDSGARDGDLDLMMGDEPVARTGAGTNVGAGDAFMGNHKTTKLNPQPGAVLVPAGAYSTPMTGQAPAAPTTPQPSASPPSQQQFSVVVGFDRGFEHASGCFSQNSGPTCSSVAPDRIDQCIADYNAGYSAGDTQRRLRIMDAYRAGAADTMLGRVSNGAGLPDAVGTCRINIIQAYNSGYRGAPPPP